MNRSRRPIGSRILIPVALGGTAALTACVPMSASIADSKEYAGTIAINPASPTGDIGVVDRTALLVAYYASDRHAEDLEALKGARDRAAEEDKATIEAFGGQLQAIAHRQLAAEEPLYTVLANLQPELQSLLDKHNLQRIVLTTGETDLLDLTDELCESIEPAE